MTTTAQSVLIGLNPTIDVPVTAFMFDGKKKVEVSFIAIFKRLSRKENRDMQKKQSSTLREIRRLAKSLATLEQDRSSDNAVENDLEIEKLELEADKQTVLLENLIRENLTGWKHLKGHEDKVVEFNDENLDFLLNTESYFIALRDGLHKSHGANYEEMERKNSKK
jgi:hypothetical protein